MDSWGWPCKTRKEYIVEQVTLGWLPSSGEILNQKIDIGMYLYKRRLTSRYKYKSKGSFDFDLAIVPVPLTLFYMGFWRYVNTWGGDQNQNDPPY